MATKTTAPKRAAGLLLSELRAGHLYLDRLSQLAVLVEVQEVTGPAAGNPKATTTTRLVRGLYYNPVYGVHTRMTLVDHQLTMLPGIPTEQ